VGLVHDDQIPVELVVLELGLHRLVAAQLVQAAEDQGVAAEAIGHLFQAGPGERLKVELEAVAHLILPLFHQVAGADDETPVHVPTDPEFLDEEAGHDRFPSPGIVGEEEAEGLAGEHFPVDPGYLVGEGIENGGVDGQEGVEQVRQVDAIGLRDEPEQAAIRVEGPGLTGGDDFEA
jgi:hypothetical protein